MPQSLSNTLVHIIFSTKNRQKLIDEKIEDKLYSYLGTVCNDKKCQSIIVNGHLDHVHIFCHLHRTVAPSKLLEVLKSYSSRWIKTQGAEYSNFYWQDGYAIYSVSQSNAGSVIKYIKDQKQKHQSKSFQEEYRDFLDAHNVDYDERFMWD